jgi:tyrosyl-tRNA synthetase
MPVLLPSVAPAASPPDAVSHPAQANTPDPAALPVGVDRAALDAAMAVVRRGAQELLVESEFERKLARSMASGKPLRCKLGLDPTAPDIHLGHTVVLNKLRQLQDLGHTVIFLIGDFTAMIGDPSGRNVTRPPLTPEQIQANARTYFEQASLVLDRERTEVRYNSEWCTPLGAEGMIRLASSYTLARLLERDDFSRRHAAEQPIAMHELLYPLMQGYDSVALRADLELGGTDQKFNLLVGRELQKHHGQEAQCVLTMPLLEGLDGVEKMSKSKGNFVGISEAPSEMFGKLMSVSDTLMWRYYELLSFRSLQDIAALRARTEAGANPRDAKVALAQEIIARFHSPAAAQAALEDFEARFRHGAAPEDMPELNLEGAGRLALPALLREAGLAASASEAVRSLEQGAVRIDGERVSDRAHVLAAGTYVLQVGKRRWARIHLS